MSTLFLIAATTVLTVQSPEQYATFLEHYWETRERMEQEMKERQKQEMDRTMKDVRIPIRTRF